MRNMFDVIGRRSHDEDRIRRLPRYEGYAYTLHIELTPSTEHRLVAEQQFTR